MGYRRPYVRCRSSLLKFVVEVRMVEVRCQLSNVEAKITDALSRSVEEIENLTTVEKEVRIIAVWS